jgi:predicted HicB family RNase H-like nuclease
MTPAETPKRRGRPRGPEPTKTVSVRLYESEVERLRAMADRQGRSVNALLGDLVRAVLEATR